MIVVSIFFFFFQAEDGIRDLYVTGVQTCALPILAAVQDALGLAEAGIDAVPTDEAGDLRAEIGRASCREECRSRWSPYHEKKNGRMHYDTTWADDMVSECSGVFIDGNHDT